MTARSHSPEPWEKHELSGVEFDGYEKIRDAEGHAVCTVGVNTIDGRKVGCGRHNARRIVACVNACRHLPTEELEDIELVCHQCGSEHDLTAGPDPYDYEIAGVTTPVILCGGCAYESGREI